MESAVSVVYGLLILGICALLGYWGTRLFMNRRR